MINEELVRERLLFVRECLRELRGFQGLSLAEFLSDSRNFAAAESFLRRALEAVFDVGRHILARTGAPGLAQEYKSIARGLGDREVVTTETADALVLMAGYRNRLVHFYHQVSPEELLAIIRTDLDDFERFVREVDAWLGRFS